MISTKHWHSHRVIDIESDLNNEYMFTCGIEGVVVVWNLKTDKKNFIPRIMSEISNIALSRDFQYIALTTRENTIKILK